MVFRFCEELVTRCTSLGLLQLGKVV